MSLQLFVAALSLIIVSSIVAATFDSAAKATNEFGLDLNGKVSTGEGNLCLSPYSIGCALAMTLAGAAGETRTEMGRVTDPR